MTAAGPEQTFFVAASTDLDGSEVMSARIREQWKKLPGSKVSAPTDVGPPADEHQPEPTDRGTSKPGTKE